MAEGSWIRIGAVDAHLNARVINPIIKEALGRKMESITQMPEVRIAVGEALIDVVTPFVPAKSKTEDLRNSARATDDGRVYWTSVHRGYNYAAKVYDEDGEIWGDEGYAKPSTEGTCPRWVEKIQPGTDEYRDFIDKVREVIIEEARKGLI